MESSTGGESEIVGNTLDEVEKKWFGGRKKAPSNGPSKPVALFGLPGGAPKAEVPPKPRETIMESLTQDYYEVLDNPKRLPFVFHPFISKEREVSVSKNRNFFTRQFFLTDDHNVQRRIFLNMQIENLAVGATGGFLVGIGTHTFFASNHGRFINQVMKTFKSTQDVTGKGYSKVLTGSLITWRIARQAAFGALLFDCVKRNCEMRGDEDDWRNSAFAGALCGGLFGLRGGPPSAIVGAAAFCGLATAQHIAPELFKSIS